MTHDEHNHGPWIAHHFDGPRQQFDAGKLGIWVFLVTEVLFFSGLFCAYVLYRAAQPEVFYQAHFHLDKILGGLNTIVLLFSSLTMAIAVRAAQLNQNKTLIINLILTMVCAAIFLGVKAVEYSHKWDEGILTRGYYNFQHHDGNEISSYLIMISILPLILLVGFAAAAALFKVTNDAKKALFFFGLALMMGGYFLGAIAGKVYMDLKPKTDHSVHAEEHDDDHAHDEKGHDDKDHDDKKGDDKKGDDKKEEHASVSGNALTHVSYRSGESSVVTPAVDEKPADEKKAEASAELDEGQKAELTEEQRRVGIFFSIYYCMTGLHAIHVIAGMIALSWLLWRAIHLHFRPDYFGPVDYVGLYWHLVDLIWIYLFPLLYLIN